MDVGDLRSLYLSGLREACDCEAQIVECLPMMAASAGSAELRSVMQQHAGWTTLHARQVEAILRRHGTRPRPGHDQVAAAMAGKAREITCGLGDPDLRDAALIAMAWCVAHHQIAAYSAAEGYAEALRLAIDRHSLLAILQQERFVDHQLSGLQGEANQMALLVSPPSC